MNAPIINDYTIAARQVESWRSVGDKIVFTNGCFDLLHRGHISYLKEAKSLGGRLILGLNDDNSLKKLKGNNRPINNQDDRALLLASLRMIDLEGYSTTDLLLKIQS